MNAQGIGYKRGREFIGCTRIEEMTFKQYKALGRVDARQRYQQEQAREKYMLGWWQAGDQFLALFKQEDSDWYGAQRKAEQLKSLLNSAQAKLKELLDFQEGDSTLQESFEQAWEGLNSTLFALRNASEYIKRRGETDLGAQHS